MSILYLQADESSHKGMDAGPHRVVPLPFTRPQRQEGCVKTTPQAYLLGSAPSEVGTQDTQMQWLSTVFSLMFTCRAWFWGLRGSHAGWRPFPLQQETCGSLRH